MIQQGSLPFLGQNFKSMGHQETEPHARHIKDPFGHNKAHREKQVGCWDEWEGDKRQRLNETKEEITLISHFSGSPVSHSKKICLKECEIYIYKALFSYELHSFAILNGFRKHFSWVIYITSFNVQEKHSKSTPSKGITQSLFVFFSPKLFEYSKSYRKLS